MSLILHIVRKDFLRLRWRLALWAGVLVAKVAHGWALLAGDGPGALVESGMQTAVILGGLDVAVCVVLVAMLVQEDLLIGTRAAWMTRPVSGGRLLAAKLTSAVLLFGVFPLLVWLPWWLHCGYGAEQMAWAAGETLGWQLLTVAPAMMMAALTDSLGRFFIWSIVVVAGGIVSGMWLMTLTRTSVQVQAEVGIAMTYATVVVGALAAVGAHYWWRRYLRTGVAALIGTGAAVATVLIAAVVLAKPPADNKGSWDENAERAAGATLAWERARIGPVNTTLRESGRGTLFVDLRLDGLPVDRRLAMGYTSQTWRWPGRPTVGDNNWPFGEAGDLGAALGIAPVQLNAETERWVAEQRAENKRRAVPGHFFEIPPQTREGKYFSVLAKLPRSLIKRLESNPADYTAKVRFTLLRAEVRREEPLAAGEWKALAGAGLRVAHVERKEFGAGVRWVGTRPLLLGELFRTESWQMHMMRRWQTGELVVIQRTAGDARRVNGDQIESSARVGTVEVQWWKTQVTTPGMRRDGKWVARDADWFSGARLAVVGWVEEARFTRWVRVEKFFVEK